MYENEEFLRAADGFLLVDDFTTGKEEVEMEDLLDKLQQADLSILTVAIGETCVRGNLKKFKVWQKLNDMFSGSIDSMKKN